MPISSPARLREHLGRGGRGGEGGWEKKEGGRRRSVGSAELHASEHDIATALLTLKQLWLPVQGLHKIGPANIPSWAVPKILPSLRI